MHSQNCNIIFPPLNISSNAHSHYFSETEIAPYAFCSPQNFLGMRTLATGTPNFKLLLHQMNNRIRPIKFIPQNHNFVQSSSYILQNTAVFCHALNLHPLLSSFTVCPSSVTACHNPLPLGMQINISSSNHMIPASCELSNVAYMAFREFNLGNYMNCEVFCNKWLREHGETYQCYVLLAFVCLRLRNYRKLEEYAENILKLNATIVEPYVFMGICCKESGRISEALEYYKLALHHHPDNIDSLIGISNCYLVINDFSAAAGCLMLGLNRYPDSLVLRHEFANIYRSMGKLDEAQKCSESVIELHPSFAPAWLLGGQIHLAQGNIWLALHYLERAIHFDPYQLDAYLVYCNILRECKLIDRSVRAYMKAISYFTEVAQLYGGLGCACLEGGMHDAAIENFKRALILQPNYPDVLCNLANALKDKGMIDEAEQHYFTAIKIAPNHADSYNNLANILRERGKVHESIQFYRKALEISPSFAAAHSNLATVYQQCGKLTESITHFQAAVVANPTNADVHCYLGNVYKEVGQFKMAVDCFIRAINLNTFSAEAHAFLANTYKDMGHTIEAIAEFTTALAYKPNFSEVFCGLVHSYLLVANWKNYYENCSKVVRIVEEQIENKRPPTVHPHHTMLFDMKQELRVSIAARHAQACIERINWLGYKQKEWNTFDLPPDEFIKIGYVSSDFCNHPTSHLIQSIPGLHDRSRFKVYCYSLTPSDQSSFRIKIESEVDYFIDVSTISDPNEVAMMIQMHGIHILLNLNGYTKGARNEIFALKPAPIQVMYLGYPGTSGASYMDYIITDKIVSPMSFHNHYTEKFAYMPNSFFIGDHAQLFPHVLKDLTIDGLITSCIKNSSYFSDWEISSNKSHNSEEIKDLELINSHKKIEEFVKYHCKKRAESFQNAKNSGEKIPDPIISNISRSQLGVPEDAFVYCNFNQIYKLDPKTFDLWCKILESVPNSYLWLLRFPKFGEDNIREYIKKFSIDQSRIVFTDVSMKEEHVRRGQLADVCLDTPLCNGHTTGMDVLWAGCPIVTLPLETFASRVGASIITSIGLGNELIASSNDQYFQIAIKLGTNKEYYKEIKSKIWYSRMTSSLFNVKIYTKDFDNLLMKIWKCFKINHEINHISLDESPK